MAEVEETEIKPPNEDEVVDTHSDVNAKRHRGKNREWFTLATYENMENAMLDFTRDHLNQNEQVLGRSVKGDNASKYINCNKITCGCNKSWRITYRSYKTTNEVILEETSDDHSNHDNYIRNGGHGLTFDQIAIVQDALLNHVRFPLKVLEYFNRENIEAKRKDPQFVDIPIPEISQLRNYISKFKKKIKDESMERIVVKEKIGIDESDMDLGIEEINEIEAAESQKSKKIKVEIQKIEETKDNDI